MKIDRRSGSYSLVLALFAMLVFSSCSTSLKMAKLPSLFGGKNKADADAAKAAAEQEANVPGNRAAGVVHLVSDRGRFVLVKSLTGGRSKVAAGTSWMSYDANGKPSAKLKVSGERKGVFVVADIVKGSPNRGDSVVLHGLIDKKGTITTAGGGDGEEKQVLE